MHETAARGPRVWHSRVIENGKENDLLGTQGIDCGASGQTGRRGSVVGHLVDHLKAGNKLRLGGLGILEVKDRPARTGRNPTMSEPVQIAASRKIAFRPAKELKGAI